MDKPAEKHHVTSKDGTLIAYERQGSGPAVILVGGGLDDGSENSPLAEVYRLFRGGNYGGKEFAILACRGGACAYPRIRRSLFRKRPTTH